MRMAWKDRRKPLWLHYLNGPRHFSKVSNMQRTHYRGSRRCAMCARGGGVRCVSWCCGVDWGEGGWHSDKVSHYLTVKISTTVSEHKQLCKHSQDAGPLLHCQASSSPHDSSYIQYLCKKINSPYLNSVFPTSRYTFLLYEMRKQTHLWSSASKSSVTDK